MVLPLEAMESSKFFFNFSRIIELIGVTNISSLDLGHITNESLAYLAKNLDNVHKLECIGFS
jgi:hypothetical protein